MAANILQTTFANAFMPSAALGIVVVPRVRLSARPSVPSETRHHSNPLRISAIGLKFDGMMRSTMKQVAS